MPVIANCLAIVATGTTIVAAIVEYRAGSNSVLVNTCEAIAVIWATKVAVDNLRTIRAVEEAKLEPLLEVALRSGWVNRDQICVVEAHAFGESSAVGVTGAFRMIRESGEAATWQSLAFSQSFVRPGQHIEAPFHGSTWTQTLARRLKSSSVTPGLLGDSIRRFGAFRLKE